MIRYLITNHLIEEGEKVIKLDSTEDMIIVNNSCKGDYKYLCLSNNGTLEYLKQDHVRIKLDSSDYQEVGNILSKYIKPGDIIVDSMVKTISEVKKVTITNETGIKLYFSKTYWEKTDIYCSLPEIGISLSGNIRFATQEERDLLLSHEDYIK